MRLLLINPSNPLVSIVTFTRNRWNRYRVWQPLSLMALAGLTPSDWDVTIHDENMDGPVGTKGPRPDLVGITAFTSQAPRAYEIAASYRRLGVPVVMGGIHATTCVEEALAHVDAVVTGEAEGIWSRVLDDVGQGRLQARYDGGLAPMDAIRPARHDLLRSDYAFGAIQTTRGCPMNCTFCCVTAFNGARYRQRPVADVVAEFVSIPESRVLVVDDNLVGTTREHIARAKALFRAMADAKTGKQWIAQATINFADDEELLTLAERAGCAGVFIGFESPTAEGLTEVGKRFNVHKGRSLAASVARIQRHHMVVVGSFIIGLDVDTPGIGLRTADAARAYGVDILNTLFLTPLPGTKLWEQTVAQGRLVLDQFPRDWQYYTLTYPVARCAQLTQQQATDEMLACGRSFYSLTGILGRVWKNIRARRRPLITACANLSNRKNQAVGRAAYARLNRECDARACVARASRPAWDAGLEPGLGASGQTG